MIDELREQCVLNRTLIIDINHSRREQDADVEYADNHVSFANGGPRRKGSLFETGSWTPIIFYWQRKIISIRDKETLASAIDVMPTILDYAGVERPDGLPGHLLRRAIEGETLQQVRESFVARLTQHCAGTNFRGEPNASIEDHMGAALSGYYRRDARWHSVWLPQSDETAFYDLENDPGQLTDASGSNLVLVNRVKADISSWRQESE